MIQKLVLALVACVIATAAAAQKDLHSANYFLAACKASTDPNNHRDPYVQGICTGITESVGDLGQLLEEPFKFCRPDAATNGQVKAVVLKFVQDNPQRMHEDFRRLAMEALRKAWPCR